MNSLATGLLIGTLLATAASSCIALFQFSSGAPWKELLEMWGKMLVLTIPTFASTTAAAMLAWKERRAVAKTAPRELPAATIATKAGAALSLSEIVVQNARDQASWHYEYGSQEPTRRAFEGEGISQTIWNSARHVLTTAKIVKGNEWSPEPWPVIEQVLDAIYVESDRVWVRPLGERTMICLHVNEQATGKKYTATRPTPQADEPEYSENQPEPGSS